MSGRTVAPRDPDRKAADRRPTASSRPVDADLSPPLAMKGHVRQRNRRMRSRKGRFGRVDHEKVFCPDPKAGDVFDLRGIDRDAGCLVVVRPDQYVALVLLWTRTTR